MKRIKYLLMTLVVAAMLMGAAYAAWSDTITLNGTVATGTLEMKADGVHIFYQDPSVVTASIQKVDDKTVQVSASNLYPGAWVYFDMKQINTGTIPVKFDNATISFTGDSAALLPYIKTWAYYLADTNGDNNNDTGGTFMFNGNLANLANAMNTNTAFKNMVIQPGGSVTFDSPEPVDINGDGEVDNNCIWLFIDPSAPNTTTEGKTMSFTLQMNWKQFNN